MRRGGKGVFDQVLVGEEIKRWTHYGRQADMCMFTVRLVASLKQSPSSTSSSGTRLI